MKTFKTFITEATSTSTAFPTNAKLIALGLKDYSHSPSRELGYVPKIKTDKIPVEKALEIVKSLGYQPSRYQGQSDGGLYRNWTFTKPGAGMGWENRCDVTTKQDKSIHYIMFSLAHTD